MTNRPPRVLIYSHDSYGLGHLRRCRAIAQSLVSYREDLSILMISGSPIVGYSSQYARDLVDTGETFVERGDVRTLAERLARLDADRGAMARLARAALQSSLRLDRDAAIFERVRLVKEFMPLGQSGEPAGSGTAAAARQARGADPTLAVAD